MRRLSSVVGLSVGAVSGVVMLLAAAGPSTAAATATVLRGAASVGVTQPAAAGNPAGHAAVPRAGRAVDSSHPTRVIGSGSPAGCTSAAVVRAVGKGGVITFNCGPKPVTITMSATAKVTNTSHKIVLDGGGKVALSGAGRHQILYMDTCDKSRIWTTSNCSDQKWPQLTVQNITLEDGYSAVKQTKTASYGGGGGGAIYAEGGRLKVVNSTFLDNRCYKSGPDLGGAAIRALAQWHSLPVYITKDTFHGGRCSNGSALSSIGTSWVVTNSVMTDNNAIGYGQNPAKPGTAGGGSGGAIYTDGAYYTVTINASVLRNNHAREGGGAIFFVSDSHGGTLRIEHSTLHHNPSAVFWTRPYRGIYFKSSGKLTVVKSTIN